MSQQKGKQQDITSAADSMSINSIPTCPIEDNPIFCNRNNTDNPPCRLAQTSLTTWLTRGYAFTTPEATIESFTHDAQKNPHLVHKVSDEALHEKLLQTTSYLVCVHGTNTADPIDTLNNRRYFFSGVIETGIRAGEPTWFEIVLPGNTPPERFEKWPSTKQAFACIDHRARYYVEFWYDYKKFPNILTYSKAFNNGAQVGLLKRCERWVPISHDTKVELNIGDVFWATIRGRWREEGVPEEVYKFYYGTLGNIYRPEQEDTSATGSENNLANLIMFMPTVY
jgi:hypothetical protein